MKKRRQPEKISKLENERMGKWGNEVNTNNTTKGNGRVGLFRREVGGFGRKRRSSEES